MKLSTAIREGSKETIKTKHTMYREKRGRMFACALGAAFLRSFGPVPCTQHVKLLSLKFPILRKLVLSPVDQFPLPRPLHEVIATMNDTTGMRREEIADWVESIGH